MVTSVTPSLHFSLCCSNALLQRMRILVVQVWSHFGKLLTPNRKSLKSSLVFKLDVHQSKHACRQWVGKDTWGSLGFRESRTQPSAATCLTRPILIEGNTTILKTLPKCMTILMGWQAFKHDCVHARSEPYKNGAVCSLMKEPYKSPSSPDIV